MPIININKLWQNFAGKAKNNPMNVVAKRFLQAFLDHGVQAAQIPRLMPAIKLDDLKSEEALLAALTPEILDQVAHLFGIRTQWLEGVDDEIYEYLGCYKQPEIILKQLADVVGKNNDDSGFQLRILSTTKKLDYISGNQQLLAPVIVEKIAELGEEEINRYYIYRDEFDWGYFPTRIELKAIARLVGKRLHTPVPLFVISDKEMRAVLDGKLVPTDLFRGALITNPSLEDFALTQEETPVAREVDEIPAVLEYINENNLKGFTFVKADIPQQSDVPEPSPTTSTSPVVKQSGKRAHNNQDLWKPVEAVASALWAEDVTIPIAEVISRIQKMPHLKASAYGASAIRKHIDELAPPNIRGKSGRKPKKSP